MWFEDMTNSVFMVALHLSLGGKQLLNDPLKHPHISTSEILRRETGLSYMSQPTATPRAECGLAFSDFRVHISFRF